MPNVTQPGDNPAGPPPPPEMTPYFRRCAEYREVLAQAKAERGLPPGPRAA